MRTRSVRLDVLRIGQWTHLLVRQWYCEHRGTVIGAGGTPVAAEASPSAREASPWRGGFTRRGGRRAGGAVAAVVAAPPPRVSGALRHRITDGGATDENRGAGGATELAGMTGTGGAATDAGISELVAA